MKENDPTPKTPLTCSFCRRPHSKTMKVFSGLDGSFICDECVVICQELLIKEQEKAKHGAFRKLLTPKEIKNKLDEFVIGQEDAKRVLSIAAYNHYKRVVLASFGTKEVPQKSNIMLFGPTGSGKTLLAKTLAKILDVPLVVVDATTFTEAGYVGGDVEDGIYRLLEHADFDLEIAQNGIIYIDEIDKIASRGGRMGVTRDVGGEGVQQALLKLIEGSLIEVPAGNKKKRSLKEESYEVDTKNILFIVGGAFIGLEKIIESRMNKKTLGFASADESKKTKEEKNNQLLQHVTVDDVVQYGMIPELMGRLPIFANLHDLDEEAMIRILTEPKDALMKQYQQLFDMEGTSLLFTSGSLRSIARQALSQKSGARGLRRVVEIELADVMYEAPSQNGLKEIILCHTTEEKPSLLGIYSNKQ